VICGNDYPFKLPAAIVDAAKTGRLVVFAGAGISTERPGAFPDSLYEEMKSSLSSAPEDLSFPSIMTSYEEEFGRLKLIQEIIERISYAKSFISLRNITTRFYQELSTIPQITEIITTNWDDFFEVCCGCLPIVTDGDYVFYNLPGRKVYKIHGSISNVSTIVATLADYRRRQEELQSSLIGGTLRHLLGTKVVVFIGYSLRDEDFQNVYSPLIEGMKELRPATYVVSPFEMPTASEFGLRQLKTDGTTFVRSLKAHLITASRNLPDSIYKRIDVLLDRVAQCHEKTSAMAWRSCPPLIFSLSYQDGLLDSLGRMIIQSNTGEYSHLPHVEHVVESYNNLLDVAVDRRRYWDASYIHGYRNAFYALLLDEDEIGEIPLYELFDPEALPPEVEMSDAGANDQQDQSDYSPGQVECLEDQVSSEASRDDQWLPEMHSQEEIVEIISGLENQYPKMLEEARQMVRKLPEPYVPQHTVFLDGVTERYIPPAI
jgi:hypothetical protein